MKISFCLITLNEESNLTRCLNSIKDLADEIIIADSGSTDKTAEIAAQFGARFEHQDWLGYVGQKNKAISLTRNEWVFSIDADEELSPDLRDEIQAIEYEGVTEEFSGIRHGDWYPDRLVRLFRKSKGRFEGGKVHERLVIDGEIKPLDAELYHHSFKDKDDHWQRCEKYAQLWAETQFENGRRVGMFAPLSHAIFRWFRGYFLKTGFLDGSIGLRIANYCAGEVHLKYKLLREMNRVKT